MRACLRLLAVLAALAVAVPALALAQERNFDAPDSNDPSQQTPTGGVQREDTPNDPAYDRAESDDEDAGTVDQSTSLYEERYDLFGFPSERTRTTALYREGDRALTPMISGFNAAGAWKLARGRPDVTVAILDTGIRWNRTGLRKRIALNPGELPPGSDANADGVVTIPELAGAGVDPNAGPNGVAGQLDAQDVIKALSDGEDDDGNGFVDDIAGWDFFDDDNDAYDSSSYFAASGHGTGRANEAAEEGNDGEGEIGVCPRCTILPIRIWDTFVSDANGFALGIVYAVDNGADVVEGANGSLYHSRFSEAASQYAYDNGVAQVFSGDDLNTGNHNYPANYDHTMLIQGTVPDAIGLGMDFGPEAADFLEGLGLTLGTQVPVTTYFRGANTTQYGGKSSISMEGATGSQNTGKAAGAAALVISAARDRDVQLTPDETRIILEQTAEDVTGGATGVDGDVAGTFGLPDRAIEGWDMHFGWGRANVGEAVRVARQGAVPPEASIGDPDWYAPLTGPSVQVTGRAAARFADEFSWRLEWAPGIEPADDDFTEVDSGTSSAPVTNLGTLDLAPVRAAMASYQRPPDPGMPVFSPVAADPYAGQFTVRLVVTVDGVDVPGVDRKVLTVLDDPTLTQGFPKRMGTGGEAPIRYADLDGDNEQELIVPLEDGTMHAYRPDGTELPGWPVTTGVMDVAASHVADSPGLSELPLPLEPLRGPIVA
ncbi:MAG: S8 family serine peptidase, partial [Actinomycetota bacterium]|nr:S8 family serine peptidase [Actinomycetota bacterium]